jgi:predicted DNA binding CopG/RHH family protein
MSTDEVKTCKDCGETKPWKDFYCVAGNKDGLNTKCKKCYCANSNKLRTKTMANWKKARKCWNCGNPLSVTDISYCEPCKEKKRTGKKVARVPRKQISVRVPELIYNIVKSNADKKGLDMSSYVLDILKCSFGICEDESAR